MPKFDRDHFQQQTDVLNIVLDHITQGMVVVGPNYRTLAFNHHYVEMFQLPAGSVQINGTIFCNIDWDEMRKIDELKMSIMNRCNKVAKNIGLGTQLHRCNEEQEKS